MLAGVLTCDGEAAKSPLILQCLCLRNSGSGRNDNGVKDEAVLEALDLAHHLGLLIGGAVVVDDAQPTKQGEVDGHRVLSHGVHGRGDKGRLEGDTLSDGSVQCDCGGGEACIQLR